MSIAVAHFPKVEQSGTLTILTFTARALREVENVIARDLDALTGRGAGRHLLLDFTHVEFLSSTELSVLISLHKAVKRSGGRLTLFNLNSDVFRLFTLTRLDTLFEICRTGTTKPAEPLIRT